MAVFKCKMCGGDLSLTEGNPVAKCEYCGSVQTVPSADNEKKLTLFSRANRLRFGCEFDKASGVYEAIVADFPEEAEAYWGLVLCKYGIEYVDDPATGNKIPTCHRSSFNSIMEDADFEQTLENADPTARKIYREEAKQIEDLRKGILEVSSKAEPYDIFICYKETDENGERTIDSVLAQDLYDALTNKGYRVFFARITLEDKLGQEYEPYIFAALNSAKVMLAVGTDYEHYNAIWVRNEWSRYLKLMAEDHTKHLIPCFKGIDAYDIPKEFAKLQAQDLGKVGATQDLLRGIDKLITPTAVEHTSSNDGAKLAEILTMGAEALENGEWNVASSRFDLALVAEPKCAEAYLGKLMAEFKCKRREQLENCKRPVHYSNYYKQTITYADDTLKEELEGYAKNIVIKLKRFIKRFSIISASVIIVSVISFFISKEVAYSSCIRDFYAQEITANVAYERLSELAWYREPDECTKFLINKAIPGSYASAESITSITVPKSANKIGDTAFKGCTNLTSITIPDSVTTIGDSAFSGCSNLTSVNMSINLENLGDYAFEKCGNLKEIDTLGRVSEIGYASFFGCTELTSITIPDSVTTIGDSAFSGCSSLTSVVIPDSVTSVGGCAFDGCTSLTSVKMSASVTEICYFTFKDCNSLNSINIPEGVTSIGNGAFSNCKMLKTLNLPEGITSIGDSVFKRCTNLTSVTIPDSVTSIDRSAFHGCYNLTTIAIPEGVTSIGDWTFNSCTSLTSVTIPDSVTFISSSAFNGCLRIKEVYFHSEEQKNKYKDLSNFKNAQLIIE